MEAKCLVTKHGMAWHGMSSIYGGLYARKRLNCTYLATDIQPPPLNDTLTHPFASPADSLRIHLFTNSILLYYRENSVVLRSPDTDQLPTRASSLLTYVLAHCPYHAYKLHTECAFPRV